MLFSAGGAVAIPVFLQFETSGSVNPNSGGDWDPDTATGTARYYLDWNPQATLGTLDGVWGASLILENDIFNLAELTLGDFMVDNSPSGWTAEFIPVSGSDNIEWRFYGDVSNYITQGPIIVDVSYELISSDRYYYSRGTDWEWDAAGGAGGPWEQNYYLSGYGTSWSYPGGPPGAKVTATSWGSTQLIPEPGTLLLLGGGLIGLLGYGRLRLKRKKK
jgi:hypothetical protein